VGHKISPKALRVGYIQDWESRWYAPKDMPDLIEEDFRIRKFLKERFRMAALSKVTIERTGKYVRVNLHTARPGVIIGKKGADKLSFLGKNMKVFENIEETGLYEMAIRIKDYLIDEVMEGRLGKAIVVYPWSKTFNLQKPRAVKLLPCDELLTKQQEFVDSVEQVIMESDPVDTISYLADMWLVCRLYEMMHDTSISEAAAQSQQLEASVQKMKKDKKGISTAFSKARKGDIDKSMREVFTSRMMTKR
jgi:F0F1-type ATP synthase gamma subunit